MKKAAARARPLWSCPRCGRTFVTRNVEHTCATRTVAEHLRGKPADVQRLYQQVEKLARAASRGKMQVVATKTMVTFRGRVGFVWVRVLRERLDLGLLLPQVLRHPRVKKIYTQSQRSHLHTFDVRGPADLDAQMRRWLRDAWRAGMQLQMSGPASPTAAHEVPEPAPSAKSPRLKERPLWRCPQCGKRFVTKNLSHSCRRISEAERLKGKTEHVVWLYRRIVKLLRQIAGGGPLYLNPGKSGIAFQARMRFGGVVLRKDSVELRFILRRRLDSPRIARLIAYAPQTYGHHLIVRDAADFDTELQAWLAESYRVGTQEHLLRKD